jgi:ABC-type bacteriocin/lantibiotic exporter with double-glycine peptidase domain
MFDFEGEKSFIEECREILDRRTVILITHRPASLALADRVLKMEQEPGEPISTVIRLPS